MKNCRIFLAIILVLGLLVIFTCPMLGGGKPPHIVDCRGNPDFGGCVANKRTARVKFCQGLNYPAFGFETVGECVAAARPFL